MPTAVPQVRTIDAHAGGGALRLIVAGLPALPGRTMLRKCAWAARHVDPLRRALLREPRGHADLTGAVFTEPVTLGAVAGLVFLRRGGFGGLCGHGLIAAVTIALERQLLIVTGTRALRIDTTAGPVEVTVGLDTGPEAAADRVTRVCGVTYRPPPVHVVQASLPIRLEGRPVRADVVWAQGYYAVVDREAIGLQTDPGVPERLRRRAVDLIETLQPRTRNWSATTGRQGRVDGVVLTGPPTRPDADLRSITVYRDGTIDRSPSGAGTAAVLALLDAMGLVSEGHALGHEGPSGAVFRARVADRVAGDSRSAIVPEISGQAWITGEHTFLLDPEDPFREGVAM